MRREAFYQDWLFGKKGKEKRKINLPHDAMQEQGRSPDAPAGNSSGFFVGGCYEYEKKFFVPEEWRDKIILLEFEGVYPGAKVSLNGELAGECRYGYNCFRIALKELIYGTENTVSVEVDNRNQPNSRWYTGAGIYRPVWLLSGDKCHILPDGVKVTTICHNPACILVETETSMDEVNEGEAGLGEAGQNELRVCIYEGENKIVEANGKKTNIEIPQAKLWSAEHPYLYRCEVSLYRNGKLRDVESTYFGVRKLEWSSDGLKVNGEKVLLKGGCIHHDNGILGARSFEVSEYRRIWKLKEFGFNAIRSAHNPLCKAALKACDELGMYVMDELWDGWDKAKTKYDYAGDFPKHYQEDILIQVRKDYNHPSVILYSIGNEVTEPAKPEGVELCGKIARRIKELDDTRPVTAGINLTLLYMATLENNPLEAGTGAAPAVGKMDSTAYNKMVAEMGNRMTLAAATEPADKISEPVFRLLDIAGYNYATSRYALEGKLHPERIVVGSETYPYEILKTWKLVESCPYLIGDFMWTAWDYLGEAGIGGWSYDAEDRGFEKRYPWLLADAGALDILGNDNAQAGMAAVAWRAGKDPYIGVCPVNHPGVTAARAIWRGSNALPHWSWQGCDGNEAQVEIYSLAAEAELFINGRSVGKRLLEEGKAVFCTVYEPGECKAVVYDTEGKAVGESCLRSAEGEIKVRILPEADFHGGECVLPDGCFLCRNNILYLDISLVGENGEIECNADQWLEIFVEGGELLAFGSARPKTEEGYLAGGCTTYYGRSQAVVRALSEKLRVTVKGKNSEKTECKIIIESGSNREGA